MVTLIDSTGSRGGGEGEVVSYMQARANVIPSFDRQSVVGPFAETSGAAGVGREDNGITTSFDRFEIASDPPQPAELARRVYRLKVPVIALKLRTTSADMAGASDLSVVVSVEVTE